MKSVFWVLAAGALASAALAASVGKAEDGPSDGADKRDGNAQRPAFAPVKAAR